MYYWFDMRMPYHRSYEKCPQHGHDVRDTSVDGELRISSEQG